MLSTTDSLTMDWAQYLKFPAWVTLLAFLVAALLLLARATCLGPSALTG
jgi:hypothetical protein